VSRIESKQLEDFVTENIQKFFEIHELPRKFLTETDIEQWEENEHFQKAKQCAQSLIQDFYSSITRNEVQKQYLLQVVSYNTELSFTRQRSVFYFRDFNNLNISRPIKPLPTNFLSKGFTICINFQLL